MKITTIGRGTFGGTLERLRRFAGHEVSELGRGADVVLLAGVTGLGDRVVIDATNRLGGEDPPGGHASVTEYVEAETTGPVAKAFNLNFGKLFDWAVAAGPGQASWTYAGTAGAAEPGDEAWMAMVAADPALCLRDADGTGASAPTSAPGASSLADKSARGGVARARRGDDGGPSKPDAPPGAERAPPTSGVPEISTPDEPKRKVTTR